MAAAKMLRLQTANPYKTNPQCPNRFRPVGTPPAQRVNFSRTTSTELKSSSSPLQYRCPAQKPLPSHCPPTQEQEQEPFFFNKVLRFLVKLTASVALGALLLLNHKPKPALAAPAGRICAISQTVDTLDEEDVTRYDAAKEINVFRVIAETIFFVLSECLLFFVLAGMLRMLRIWPISLQPSTIDVIQDKVVGFFMIMALCCFCNLEAL